MSYAQGTTHYNFPQIVGTDRPTFADANVAFRTLDTKLYALEGSATEVDGRLDTAEGNIVQLQSDVQTAQGTADLAKSTADTAVEQIGITNANVSQLTTRVGNKFDSVGIADPYDTAATYSVGNVVTYNGQRYRCTTAVTVAEPFDVTKWTGEDVETVLNEIKSDLDGVKTELSSIGNYQSLADGSETAGTVKTVDLTPYKQIAICIISSDATNLYAMTQIDINIFKLLTSLQCSLTVNNTTIYASVHYNSNTSITTFITDGAYRYVVYGVR